jgi:hypothetical protein
MDDIFYGDEQQEQDDQSWQQMSNNDIEWTRVLFMMQGDFYGL